MAGPQGRKGDLMWKSGIFEPEGEEGEQHMKKMRETNKKKDKKLVLVYRIVVPESKFPNRNGKGFGGMYAKDELGMHMIAV